MMRGITRIIKRRAMENFIGLMVEYTKDNGRMDCNKEKANILTDKDLKSLEKSLKGREDEFDIILLLFNIFK